MLLIIVTTCILIPELSEHDKIMLCPIESLISYTEFFIAFNMLLGAVMAVIVIVWLLDLQLPM